MSFRQITRIAIVTFGLTIATAPAFAWSSGGSGGCWGSSCGGGGGGGGTPVPEPSTLALLGVAIPGAAAWIKRKIG